MLGFILSKLNLLILVTAIFAIVVFFTFSLNDFFIVQKANDVSDTIAAQVTALIVSPAYCAKNIVQIPDELSYLGGRKAFYVLEIASVPLDTENTTFGLKFTMLDRREQNKVIASTRINIPGTSEIRIYTLKSGTPNASGNYSNSFILDPQAITPIDAFYMAKEVWHGKTYIFIVPCSARATTDNCGNNARYVVENSIAPERNLSTESQRRDVCLSV